MKSLKLSFLLTLILIASSVKINAQNYALNFANSNDVVSINQDDVSGSWTAELWVYKNQSLSYSTLINGVSGKITLESFGNGGKVGITKKTVADWAFNYVVPVGAWTHLAFVSNGTSTSLYVNGAFQETINQFIDLPIHQFGESGESPRVQIDEVRFWNIERTQQEISDSYNKSLSLPAAGLIGYWYFDDQATTATDLSLSQYDGQITSPTYIANNNPNFTTNLPSMSLQDGSAFNENGYFVEPNSTNQDVLSIVITTVGITNPIDLNEIVVNLNGTDNISDITNVKMYTTGRNSEFSTDSQFASTVAPTLSALTFTENITLKSGNNYFWLAYDVPNSAIIDNKLDAELVSYKIDNQNQNPTNGTPLGHRRIQNKPIPHNPNAIIPKPQQMVLNNGSFELVSTTEIAVSGATLDEGNKLSTFLQKATGFPFTVANGGDAQGNISLSILGTVNTIIGDEGYLLNIDSDGIRIEANTTTGIFYGWQSLRQLLPNAIESSTIVLNRPWNLSHVQIEDYPRFKWRGMHLDVARHIYTVDFVKKYLDGMAMNKLNYFHWHLTEDQGWRVEVLGKPLLQSVSAWRNCNGSTYGGYYTQAQITEIVEYAAQLHIEVVPEIEMPGHSVEVLAAFPELSCATATLPNGGPFDVRCAWGISDDIFCAGKEATFDFIEEVLDEIIPLFPGKYIHLGGDEAPKVRWQACPDCQARIGAEGLANEEELQKYFMERVGTYLASKGKEWIGWSEITYGGVPNNATVMSWLGESSAILAAQQGHDAIMSPTRPLYFDYANTNDPGEPFAWGTSNTVSDVYHYNPIPSVLTPAQQQHILGPHAPLWTEHVSTEDHAEYMVFPRSYALAEIAWSSNDKDFNDFENRLYYKFERLDLLDYNYKMMAFPTVGISEEITTCEANVTLEVDVPGTSFYWNDENNSTTKSIEVTQSGTYKVYVEFFNEIKEFQFHVTLETPISQVNVEENNGGGNPIWTAIGDADDYLWYENSNPNEAVFIGNPFTPPVSNTDPNNYSVSGVLEVNKKGAINITGGSDHVLLDNADFLNGSTAFTFESWLNIKGYSTWDQIFDKRISNSSRIALELEGNTIYCEIGNGSNTYARATNTIADSQWHHVAMVYDGTGATNAEKLKLYIDGVDTALTFQGTIPSTTATNSSNLTIGDSSYNPNFSFTELKIWDKALTSEEIAISKQRSLSGNEPDLTYYFQCDSGSGSILNNTSTNNSYNATLVNATPSIWQTDILPFTLFGCESTAWNIFSVLDVESFTENVASFKVYPNPSNSIFTVSMKLNNAKNVGLRVRNLLGNQLYKKDFNSVNSINDTFNMSNFSKGIYILEIIIDGQSNGKLIIKN